MTDNEINARIADLLGVEPRIEYLIMDADETSIFDNFDNRQEAEQWCNRYQTYADKEGAHVVLRKLYRPYYSDWEAVGKLIDWAVDNHWIFGMGCRLDGITEAHFVLSPYYAEDMYFGHDQSRTRAICQAFLRAHGQELPQC